jgi:NADH:ubiquinone oxidoreductase subunit 6 (subunit J)
LEQGTVDIIMIILQVLLVVSALLVVLIRNLLKAAISLAAMSVVLAIVMFVLNSPVAAVFELSICAGLITAIFVSVITLTKPATIEEQKIKSKERRTRYILLPILVVLIAVGLMLAWPSIQLNIASISTGDLSLQANLWNVRQLDLLGQIIIILAGVFGVVVLFKDRR